MQFPVQILQQVRVAPQCWGTSHIQAKDRYDSILATGRSLLGGWPLVCCTALARWSGRDKLLQKIVISSYNTRTQRWVRQPV